jgi:hypothetical protein
VTHVSPPCASCPGPWHSGQPPWGALGQPCTGTRLGPPLSRQTRADGDPGQPFPGPGPSAGGAHSRAGAREAGDAMEAPGLERFGQAHRRQDSGEPPRQPPGLDEIGLEVVTVIAAPMPRRAILVIGGQPADTHRFGLQAFAPRRSASAMAYDVHPKADRDSSPAAASSRQAA